MALQVIGAGFGRTDTMSLKLGLEQLGFVKRHHMVVVFEHREHIPLRAAAHDGEPVDWPALFTATGHPSTGLPATSGASSSRLFPTRS